MSFKIVLFAAAVFGYQVNAQMGGIVRPFATGFTNGFAEVAKPFVQFGQPVLTPASEFVTGQRFPYIPQMMNYPSKIAPQAQNAAYEGFDAFNSGIPGANYFQAVRPQPPMKPQTSYFQFPSQTPYVRPTRPFPTTLEEAFEMYRPSNLLIKPDAEVPKTEQKIPADVNHEASIAEAERKE